MVKMNQEVKKKWVEALLSGDYKQGKGQLRDEQNRFCCLGVLCNLHAKEHPHIAAKEKNPTEYMGYSSLLSQIVSAWAGSNRHDFAGIEIPVVINGKIKWNTLAGHNDSGVSFKRLAKAIDENL